MRRNAVISTTLLQVAQGKSWREEEEDTGLVICRADEWNNCGYSDADDDNDSEGDNSADDSDHSGCLDDLMLMTLPSSDNYVNGDHC